METAGHSGPFALDTIPDADRLAADPLACPPADLSLETTCRCSYEPTTGSASSTSCVHQKRENVNYESQGSINNHYCSSTDYDMQSFPIQLASSPYPKSLEISSNPVFATSCQTWQDSMPIQTDGRYPPRSLWLENICQNLVRDMQNHGLCVIDNFLESFGSRRDLILEEVNLLYDSDMFKEGRLVNNKLKGIPIRNDKIVWVSGQEELCSQIGFLVRLVDTIIVNCSALAFENVVKNCNIQTRTKAMIACYPGDGARYVKHVDNPNEDGRCITCIYYLNRDWDVQRNGGLLRLFPSGSDRVANIAPLFDRLIFFWSDRRNPHEVQEAYRTRFAITVWYLTFEERQAQLEKTNPGYRSTDCKLWPFTS